METSRPNPIVLLMLSCLCLLGPARAGLAQDPFPTPGGAPGADTGDASGPFSGLAATPGTNPFTGTASTSIPIGVPPGRGRMTPRLALVYSSRQGASDYGYGWSLPLAQIHRSTKHGVPHYDGSDTFVLELGSASVELEAVAATRRYQAKVEGAYLRIGFDSSSNTWLVIDKSGTSLLFGSAPEARLGPDPQAADTTYTWLLSRSLDTFGNHIDYSYLPAQAGQGSAGLPAEISYGGNLRTATPHLFSIRFYFLPVDYPATPPAFYGAGFLQKRAMLLAAIETYAGGQLVRRYSMSHELEPVSGAQRLIGVSLQAYADDPAYDVSLPSTVFSYAPALQMGWPIGSAETREAQAVIFDSPGGFREIGTTVHYDTFDINGDSIVDYVRAADDPPTVRLGTNHGFSAPALWSWPASARRIRHTNSHSNLDQNIFDITGDGLPDLVDARASACGSKTWCVYRNTGSGFETSAMPWPAPIDDIRHADSAGRTIKADMADLNGDGRPDWIDASKFRADAPYWHVYWNTGTGFDQTPFLFPAQSSLISRVVHDDSGDHVLFGLFDMNGDGLADFVLADAENRGTAAPRSVTQWQVYLNSGRGFASEPLDWKIEGAASLHLPNFLSSSRQGADWTTTSVELVDMTGDGLPDLVRPWEADDLAQDGLPLPSCTQNACEIPQPTAPPECCVNLLVYVNTGSSFSYPVGWPAWFANTLRAYRNQQWPQIASHDLFDFDGDGLIDLVEVLGGTWRLFRNPASPLAKGSTTPVELRTRPNLLVAMLNGVGGETHLSYAPTSSTEDNEIPFPLWITTERKIHDGLLDQPVASTTYFYEGALYAGEEREFRGFHRVWEVDELGRITVSEFHQGARRRGLLQRSTRLASGGCSLNGPPLPGDPCDPWNHVLREDLNVWSDSGPVLLEQHRSTPYFEGTAISELSKVMTFEYDEFGNVVHEIISSPSAGTVASDTLYAYSVVDGRDGMPSRYLVDRPLHTTTAEPGGSSPLAEKTFSYDAARPVTGALKASSTCMEWNASACSRWSTTTYRSDKLGNVVRVKDPEGGVRTMTMDPHGLYPYKASNAAGQITTTLRDLRNGRAVTSIEPDGRKTETLYDGLGRAVRSWTNGFSKEQPEITTSYVEGEAGSGLAHVRTDRFGSAPAVVFYDGLGREIAAKTLVETPSGNKTMVVDLRRYSDSGQLVARAEPFDAPDPSLERLTAFSPDGRDWTEYLYDTEGRLEAKQLPDGSQILYDTSMPGVRIIVQQNLAAGTFPGTATIELSDGLGRVWRRDVCSRAPAFTDPLDCPEGSLKSRSTYTYDGLDRVIESVHGADPETASVVRTAWDGAGNRKAFWSSDLGNRSYEYSAGGLLRSATDAEGNTVGNTYDRLGRLLKQAAGPLRSRYSYYKAALGAGRLHRVRSRGPDTKVTKDFVYDERGRVVRERFRIRAGARTKRWAFYYTYDRADRRLTVSYPSSSSRRSDLLHFTYSPFGQLRSLSLEGVSGNQEILREIQYDQLGRTTRVDYGNRLRDLYEYAPPSGGGRLRCLRTTAAQSAASACNRDSADLVRLSITERDTAGNVLRVTDDLHPDSSPLNEGRSFAYDSLGRLARVMYEPGYNETFNYDAAGNLIQRNEAVYSYQAGAPHLLSMDAGQTVEHDRNGNRTVKGPWAYRYDELGRLKEIDHDSVLRVRNYYDEGQTRVARYDATTGTRRYYFGGFFELEGDTLIRHFSAGGRIVATDRIPAPRKLALMAGLGARTRITPQSSRPGRSVTLLASSRSGRSLLLLLVAVAALGWVAAMLLLPGRGRTAWVTALVFMLATLPIPPLTRSLLPEPRAQAGFQPSILYYHPDQLGSPHLLSDGSGAVVEHRRYAAYGALTALYNAAGTPLDRSATEISFAGQQAGQASGLIYFGARFYDPELGLFLTPDPGAQFASPYLYAGGNPVNGADTDGELFGALFGGIFLSTLWASAASAFISGILAAYQGGSFLDAAKAGLTAGAIGTGVGTLLGGLNIAYQMATGVQTLTTTADVVDVAVEVAMRSAFTTTVTHAAVTVAQTAGLPSDWSTALGIATALASSYAYDNFVVKDSGAAGSGLASQREMAKTATRQVNTTLGHINVTEEAATKTGWEYYTEDLVEINTAQDGPRGWSIAKLKALATNQDHFGRLPAAAMKIRGQIEAATATVGKNFEALASGARVANPFAPYLFAMGRAAHLTQDYLTLGHMVPGTALFAGPVGAPIRFVIHQVFGGEIAFRAAQKAATHSLLLQFPAPV